MAPNWVPVKSQRTRPSLAPPATGFAAVVGVFKVPT